MIRTLPNLSLTANGSAPRGKNQRGTLQNKFHRCREEKQHRTSAQLGEQSKGRLLRLRPQVFPAQVDFFFITYYQKHKTKLTLLASFLTAISMPRLLHTVITSKTSFCSHKLNSKTVKSLLTHGVVTLMGFLLMQAVGVKKTNVDVTVMKMKLLGSGR